MESAAATRTRTWKMVWLRLECSLHSVRAVARSASWSASTCAEQRGEKRPACTALTLFNLGAGSKAVRRADAGLRVVSSLPALTSSTAVQR